jgi:hypothetical protein
LYLVCDGLVAEVAKVMENTIQSDDQGEEECRRVWGVTEEEVPKGGEGRRIGEAAPENGRGSMTGGLGHQEESLDCWYYAER